MTKEQRNNGLLILCLILLMGLLALLSCQVEDNCERCYIESETNGVISYDTLVACNEKISQIEAGTYEVPDPITGTVSEYKGDCYK